MAGKRGATSELNHDNWDKEEEVEEQGTFQKASNDRLKNRVIKTARRRNPIRAEGDEKTSAFASFTGFSAKPQSTDFSFLNSTTKSNTIPKLNGITTEEAKSTSMFSLNSSTSSKSLSGTTNIFASASFANTSKPVGSGTTNKSEQYCSKLKGLNESVSKWIVKKVEENALISLQPIFKDYEKYLNEIEKEENTDSQQKTDKPSANTPIPTFNFNPAEDKNNVAIPDSTTEKLSTKKSKSSATFKFGASGSTISANPTFSFGPANNPPEETKSFSTFNSLTSSSSKPTFSFGSSTEASKNNLFQTSTPFSLGEAKETEKPEQTTNEEKGNENEDEPPKVEFKAVVEKDHIYTIRCKVFVKNGDTFGDRGVGNLYLKSIENSEKVQLIVRADTNLGNLLLNMILSDSVPTKRMGKKDVMLVAIPTPDAKPPPVPLLLRVKSPEDADKLLEVLDKHKK